jgi:hypothetical protein
MKKADEHYSYFEKLMKAAPETITRESPEYKALSARYPHLSEYIRLRRELGRLKRELGTVKDRSRKSRLRREIEGLANRLRQQSIRIRLHGERKPLSHYERRLFVTEMERRVSSMVLEVRLRARRLYMSLQNRLRERARRARYKRASMLPPSLFEIRSLDPLDRILALRDWMEKRRVGILEGVGTQSVSGDDHPSRMEVSTTVP